MSRARLALSAIRTAISLCRAAERASIRFATFEQAINKTMPATAASTAPANRTIVEPPPNRTSLTGRTVTVWPSFAAGYSRARTDATVVTLACACDTAAPRFSRPTPRSVAWLRSVTAVRISLGRSCSPVAMGSHKSGPTRPLTPMNPARATPITVTTCPLSRSCRPNDVRRPAKPGAPCAVVHDGDGVRTIMRVRFRPERPAGRETHPQRGEVIASHELAHQPLRGAVRLPTQRAHPRIAGE